MRKTLINQHLSINYTTLTPSVRGQTHYISTAQSPEKCTKVTYHQLPSPNKHHPDFSIQTSDEKSLHPSDASIRWEEEERLVKLFVVTQKAEEACLANREGVTPFPEVEDWELEAAKASDEEVSPLFATITVK